MSVAGNIDHLKKEIEGIYSAKLEEFRQENLNAFSSEKAELEEKHKADLSKAKEELAAEEKKVFSTTLAEEKIKAKKEFEYTREGLINKVFIKAEERSKDFLLSRDYIELVKRFTKAKDSMEITGSFDEYKEHFPDMKTDTKIEGILVRHGRKVFDFTYSTFIESRRSDLRHRISTVLFEK